MITLQTVFSMPEKSTNYLEDKALVNGRQQQEGREVIIRFAGVTNKGDSKSNVCSNHLSAEPPQPLSDNTQDVTTMIIDTKKGFGSVTKTLIDTARVSIQSVTWKDTEHPTHLHPPELVIRKLCVI